MFQFTRDFKTRKRAAAWACAATWLVTWAGAAGTWAQTTPALAEGQKVEVREGDTWSAATVVKKEGRKFLIHYNGSESSTDEWVTSDRVRVPGQSVSPPAGASPPSAIPAAPAPKPFAIGERIEFKSGPWWNKGIVINVRGKWYFVQHDNSRDREWVEPWRIRKLGLTEDKIGWVESYGAVRNGQGPPREDPGESPLPGESTTDMLKRQAAEKADAAAPLTRADRSAMAELKIGADPGRPFAPDPEPQAAHLPLLAPVLLAGNPPGVFWLHVENVFITSDGSTAGLMLEAGDERWFERVNLVLGRSMGRSTLRPNCRALDLSEDGKLLAVCPKKPDHGIDRVEIWNVQSPQLQHVISFEPDDQGDGNIREARFVGSDHVLTLDDGGRMVLWDLKARAIWSMRLRSGHVAAFSPGRKQFAAWGESTLSVFDAMTGKTLRDMPTSARPRKSIAFRPDGVQIAMFGEQALVIQDLISGKEIESLNPLVENNRELTWVNDGYLLAGNSRLIGLREQMVVWIYDKLQDPKFRRPPQSRGMINLFNAPVGVESHGRFWYGTATSAEGTGQPILASTVLPDDHVREILSTLKVAGEMAIQPGAAVSVEVNLPDDIKQTVDLALRSALADNGLKIVAGQPIKLVASTSEGNAKEMIYARGMFMMPAMMPGKPPPDAVHMNVAEVTSSLAFVAADGHKLWERTHVQTPPMSFRLKKDQPIQDAVKDAMKPTQWFFVRTPIPKLVPKAAQPNGFGVSEFTGQGPVPES